MPTPITVRTGTRHEPAAAAVPKRRITAAAMAAASGPQRARGASGAALARRRGALQHQQRNASAELVNVAHVIDMWEIEDEWWRKQPVRRRYWHVTLETGQDLTVFQDLQSGEWYQQDY